ncbi:MAG: hypothetical protein GY913_03310 [Proteobacteria bacterium]|nr:hypothetical protein [Pseudomonadota bacterium]
MSDPAGRYDEAAHLYGTPPASAEDDMGFYRAEALGAMGDIEGALLVLELREPLSIEEIVAESLLLDRNRHVWTDASVSEMTPSQSALARQYIEVEGAFPPPLGRKLKKQDLVIAETVEALVHDPAAALVKGRRLEDANSLGVPAALLLYGQALARDEDEVIQIVETTLYADILTPVYLAAVRGDHSQIHQLPMSARAAALLGRALHPEVSTDEQARLVEEARANDAFHGIVHRVADTRGL